MLVRIWRTGIDRGWLQEYASFEEERSLPMFREQRGFLGVLFLREGADRAAALTLWEDMAAVEALTTSPSYLRTVQLLVNTGLLIGEQSIDVFEVKGGRLRWEEIRRRF